MVGIRTYPDLGDLDGPERDAEAFYEWLLDPTGGDVPRDNVRKIVSSDFTPPFPVGQEPTVLRVQAAIQEIQSLSSQNVASGRPKRVGRRLYLYLAGHGFTPAAYETALLMANASILRSGAPYHVLGTYSARWFYNAAYFDEILLFMDCCRELATTRSLNMGFGDEIDPDAATKCKYFQGFGTKWAKNVREQEISAGVVRGIFTTTLLAGLWGGAIDPEREGGVITARSLQAYLYNNLINLIPRELRDDPDVPTDPDVTFDPPAIQGRPDSFVIARATVKPQGFLEQVRALFGPKTPTFTATFDVAAPRQGRRIVVLSGVGLAEVQSAAAAPAAWTVTLAPGTYVVQCDGVEKIFELTGAEAQIHVPV